MPHLFETVSPLDEERMDAFWSGRSTVVSRAAMASECYDSPIGPVMVLFNEEDGLWVVPVTFGVTGRSQGIRCWASRGPWGRPFVLEIEQVRQIQVSELGRQRGRVALMAFRHAWELHGAQTAQGGTMPPQEWLNEPGVPGTPQGLAY